MRTSCANARWTLAKDPRVTCPLVSPAAIYARPCGAARHEAGNGIAGSGTVGDWLILRSLRSKMCLFPSRRTVRRSHAKESLRHGIRRRRLLSTCGAPCMLELDKSPALLSA
jgi:hypothetical protein